MATDKKSGNVEVHVCRFIDYRPSSISCIAIDEESKYAAIGRSNGNIEIWDLDGSFIQRTIPGLGENSVQAILLFRFSNELRLITAGLDGWLYEWDLETLETKFGISCQANGIWDIKQCYISKPNNLTTNDDIITGMMIACACDDGSIRIYRLAIDEFIYQCTFACSSMCYCVY